MDYQKLQKANYLKSEIENHSYKLNLAMAWQSQDAKSLYLHIKGGDRRDTRRVDSDLVIDHTHRDPALIDMILATFIAIQKDKVAELQKEFDDL